MNCCAPEKTKDEPVPAPGSTLKAVSSVWGDDEGAGKIEPTEGNVEKVKRLEEEWTSKDDTARKREFVNPNGVGLIQVLFIVFPSLSPPPFLSAGLESSLHA